MKLAIIGSRGFPSTYGGYETLVRHIAPEWVGQGHEVTVYCRQRPERSRSTSVEGVRCIWTPGFDSKSWSTLSFGASSHVDAALRGYDAALVLNVANGFYLPLLKARGIPTVVNTDGIEWERGKWSKTAQKVFYRGAAMAARHADVLVADSQAIARIWQRLFDVSARFIPYGAPVLDGVRDDRIRSLGLTPRTYALVVARLIPENNVELTLDALEAPGWHPTTGSDCGLGQLSLAARGSLARAGRPWTAQVAWTRARPRAAHTTMGQLRCVCARTLGWGNQPRVATSAWGWGAHSRPRHRIQPGGG